MDMVIISRVFHHFVDPERGLAECRRVLRRSGAICLRGGTTDRIGDYPYVWFFARSRAVLNEVMQSQGLIAAAFASAGFDLVHHQVVLSEVARSWFEYAGKIAFRADSILVRLTDQEFADGLAALRGHAATATPDEAVIELIDFFVFRPAAASTRSTA